MAEMFASAFCQGHKHDVLHDLMISPRLFGQTFVETLESSNRICFGALQCWNLFVIYIQKTSRGVAKYHLGVCVQVFTYF